MTITYQNTLVKMAVWNFNVEHEGFTNALVERHYKYLTQDVLKGVMNKELVKLIIFYHVPIYTTSWINIRYINSLSGRDVIGEVIYRAKLYNVTGYLSIFSTVRHNDHSFNFSVSSVLRDNMSSLFKCIFDKNNLQKSIDNYLKSKRFKPLLINLSFINCQESNNKWNEFFSNIYGYKLKNFSIVKLNEQEKIFAPTRGYYRGKNILKKIYQDVKYWDEKEYINLDFYLKHPSNIDSNVLDNIKRVAINAKWNMY